MRFLLCFVVLLSLSSTVGANPYDQLTPELTELVNELKNHIFQEDHLELIDDVLNSSSVSEVDSFIRALEQASDPTTMRAYLSYLSEHEATSVKFMELLKKRIQQDPIRLRKIAATLHQVKDQMKRANLRFPTPIRCAAGIATYVGIQDWFLSNRSSFFSDPAYDDFYKEEIVNPVYTMVVGFAVTTCLGDAILSYRNARDYFRELNNDLKIKKKAEHYLSLVQDLSSTRQAYTYSKANIELFVYVDQHIDRLSQQLSEQVDLKIQSQQSAVRKSLRGLYRGFVTNMRHRKIRGELDRMIKKGDLEGQELLDYLTKEFADFSHTYKQTSQGNIIRELESEYNKDLTSLMDSRQPSRLSKICYTGVGVATTILGLHAAAGARATNIDEPLTTLTRNYYTEYQHLILPALVSPCIWQLNHLPRIIFRSFENRQKMKHAIINHKNLTIAKKALLNPPGDEQAGTSLFNSPREILRHAIAPKHERSKKFVTMPSGSCLKKILSLIQTSVTTILGKQTTRSPAAISTCRHDLMALISGKRASKQLLLNSEYQHLSQYQSYHQLRELLRANKDRTQARYYDLDSEISGLAARHCQ